MVSNREYFFRNKWLTLTFDAATIAIRVIIAEKLFIWIYNYNYRRRILEKTYYLVNKINLSVPTP